MTISKLKIIVLAGLIVGLISAPVEASLRIYANPSSGGSSLRFGRVESPAAEDQEVRLRVSSPGGQQYQVFQRISDPLVNDQGVQLPRQSILSSSIGGSNSTGSLYLQTQELVGYTDQLIYTSNPDGLDDAFVIIYHIDENEISEAGDYLGRMQYSVRPIGGAGQDNALVDIYVTLSDEKRFNLQTSSASNSIRLSSEGQLGKEGWAEFSLRANRKNLRLYQEFIQFPENEEAIPLEDDVLEFWVEAQSGQAEVLVPTPVLRRRERLYSTTESDDTIRINMQLNEQTLSTHPAGQYRGRLRYVLESDGVEKTFNVDLDIYIAPVFTLDVEYPSEGMRYARILPTSPEQVKQVQVKVRSNLGRPFAVRQTIQGPLTNSEGKIIPTDHFLIQQQSLTDDEGSIIYENWQAVKMGDSIIFRSGRQGMYSEFNVFYKLLPFTTLYPGDYQTSIVYSLEEI